MFLTNTSIGDPAHRQSSLDHRYLIYKASKLTTQLIMYQVKRIHNLPGSKSIITPFYRAADYDTYLLSLLSKLNQAYDDDLID